MCRPLALALCLGSLLMGCGSEDDTAPGTSATTSGAGGSGGGGGAPTGPLSPDVVSYRYAFDLEAETAQPSLDIAVTAPGGDCVTLQSELAATSTIQWNGEPARSATLDGGQLEVCGAGLSAGATLTLATSVAVPEKTFHGLDVGFSKETDQDGGTFTYLLSWVGGCDHFGPCNDDPGTLSEMHVEVHHAPGDQVLCPGVLSQGDTTTRCDVAGALAPTYSAFSFASDPLWVRNDWHTAAGVDIVFYEVPSGQLAQSLDPATVTTLYEWLTGLLGPFPYGDEMRYAGGPTVWLGFEHPANVILQEGMPTLDTAYADTTMHVFSHETIHQWAGDKVTIATPLDFVWKEAIAEYLSYVFEDEHLSGEEAAASLAYWDSVSLQSKHFPRPTDDPPPSVASFYGDVYGPGPMVLFVQLEALIGRPAVEAALQTFLADSGVRSVSELRAALEAASGKDLGAYFDAWVFGSGKPEWPTFTIATEQVGDQVDVTVTQDNASGRLYPCVVEVDVKGATQQQTAVIDFGLAPSAASSSATVTLSEPVEATSLDPRHKLVARVKASGAAPSAPVPVWIL